jgi:YVTN family beta-propeller protein
MKRTTWHSVTRYSEGVYAVLSVAVVGSLLLSGLVAHVPQAQSPGAVAPPAALSTSQVHPAWTAITVGAGNGPYQATYDSGNGYVYVTNTGSSTVTVINGTTQVATVPVQEQPQTMVYDPEDGDIYVSSYMSYLMTVINGTTVVGSPVVNMFPGSACYDSENGFVYVPSWGGNVTVLNGTHVVARLKAGWEPVAATCDSGTGWVYVSNSNSGNVTVINGTRVVGSVTTGVGPQGGAYDRENGCVYIPNFNTDNVSVVNGTTLVGTIAVGGFPRSDAYDGANGYVYVVNSELNDSGVSVIDGLQVIANLTVGSNPWSGTYDSWNGDMYVTNLFSTFVSVISGTTVIGSVNVGSYPRYATYDSGNGYVYVPNGNSGNVSVFPTIGYTVTFTETGLPKGTSWSVDLGGVQQESNATTDVFFERNGSYNYSVESSSGYVASPATGSVTVGGQVGNVLLRFALPYAVTFLESGLPSGTTWSVTLGGTRQFSNSTSTSFAEINGTYSFSLGTITGYVVNPASGSLTVNGGADTIPVGYSTQPTYAVVFVETGLPAGTYWSVNLSGSPGYSTSTSLQLLEPDGSYTWEAVASVNGSSVSTSGSLTVNGKNVDVGVAFSLPSVLLTFLAIGLTSGTNWSVTLTGPVPGESSNGLTRWSDGTPSVSFRVAPGTYTYATTASGYPAVLGTVDVSSISSATVRVSFVPITSPPPTPASPPVAGWAVGVGLGFVVFGAAGLLATGYRYRARERERVRLLVGTLYDTDWKAERTAAAGDDKVP